MTEPAPYSMWPVPLPPPPPRRRRTWWIPVLVAVGILLLIGFIGIVATVVGAVFAHRASPGSTLASGAPGPHVAVSPLACPDACFTTAVTSRLIPDYPVLGALGLSRDLYPPGTYDPVTAGQMYRSSLADWRASSGDPDDCFFTIANSPVDDAVAAGKDQLADPVSFIGTWTDTSKTSVVDVSARVFPDSATAGVYLATLSRSISSCDRLQITRRSTALTARVVPEAAIRVPDSEAEAGWARLPFPGDTSRAYVTDLQRGNLVVRVRVLTDGTISEAKFRSFVATYAQTQLGPLTVQ